MFSREVSGRRASRAAVPSVLRIGAALAGLLAVTVSFAAWSSSKSVTPAKSSRAETSTKISKKDCRADKAAGQITYVSPFAYSATASVIDMFEAQKLGYFKQLCLNVTINAAAQSPQVLVSAGLAQVSSTGGANNLITYIAEGDPLVGVMTLGKFDASTVIMPKQYTKLKQLDGETFGYYNSLSVGYLELLVKGGVDVSKVKFVKLTNRDPRIITTGQVQGIATFLSSQDLELREDKVPFTEIIPASEGIKGTSNVYYMNKKFLKAHRVAAANFLRADLKALQYCLVHTKPCVQNLANVATAAGQGAVYGVKQDSPSWAAASKALKAAPTKPLGTQTDGLWLPDYNAIKTYSYEASRISGLAAAKINLPPLKSLLDTKLVSGLYKNGKLIWP